MAVLSEAELREFAESPTLFSEKGDEDEHLLTDGYSLLVGPGIAIVDRIRLEPESFEATVEEIRRAVADRGHSRLFWSISEWATPPHAVERLIDMGVVSSDAVWELAGMGLATEPPVVEGVRARRAETLEEFAAANEVEHEVLERTEERCEELRASYEERFESEHLTGRNVRFLAWIDGEPVATAPPSGRAAASCSSAARRYPRRAAAAPTAPSSALAGIRRSSAGRRLW